MSLAINGAMYNYAYGYGQKLQPKIDKNDDGKWSKPELQNYANAYDKATGNKLDVDSLLEKYGENGYIGFKGQESAKKDDALGLSKLANAASEQLQKTWESAAKSMPTLEELLADMSPSGKMFFSSTVSKLETQQNLISSFSALNGSDSGFESIFSAQNASNMYRAQMSYAASGAVSAMAGQLMNYLV